MHPSGCRGQGRKKTGAYGRDVLYTYKVPPRFLSFLLCSASPSSTFQYIFNRPRTAMAPSLLDTQPTAPHQLSSPAQTTVDTKIFPDGIKTSGQHPPLYDLLRPYSDFPKNITGETVWKAEDYTNNPERWVHVLNDEEVNELGAAADKFIADKTPLTGISKVSQIIIPMDPCLIFCRRIFPCQSCPSC